MGNQSRAQGYHAVGALDRSLEGIEETAPCHAIQFLSILQMERMVLDVWITDTQKYKYLNNIE